MQDAANAPGANVHGGTGSDLIDATGCTKGLHLYGEDGNDTLKGGGGTDTIEGGQHDDTIYGYGGGDFLYGNEHNDTIYGGAQTDFIVGGLGVDNMFGEAGDDEIDSRDGVVDGTIDGGGDLHDKLSRDGNENVTDSYSGFHETNVFDDY